MCLAWGNRPSKEQGGNDELQHKATESEQESAHWSYPVCGTLVPADLPPLASPLLCREDH
jgi:hypothetical protein